MGVWTRLRLCIDIVRAGVPAPLSKILPLILGSGVHRGVFLRIDFYDLAHLLCLADRVRAGVPERLPRVSAASDPRRHLLRSRDAARRRPALRHRQHVRLLRQQGTYAHALCMNLTSQLVCARAAHESTVTACVRTRMYLPRQLKQKLNPGEDADLKFTKKERKTLRINYPLLKGL